MNATPDVKPHQVDPIQLMLGSSGIVLVVLVLLMVASFAVWVIWLLKTLQVSRMRNLNQKYVEEIVQAERLAIVGRFATGIVHDFKVPLAIIGLATDLACSRSTRWSQRHSLRQS